MHVVVGTANLCIEEKFDCSLATFVCTSTFAGGNMAFRAATNERKHKPRGEDATREERVSVKLGNKQSSRQKLFERMREKDDAVVVATHAPSPPTEPQQISEFYKQLVVADTSLPSELSSLAFLNATEALAHLCSKPLQTPLRLQLSEGEHSQRLLRLVAKLCAQLLEAPALAGLETQSLQANTLTSSSNTSLLHAAALNSLIWILANLCTLPAFANTAVGFCTQETPLDSTQLYVHQALSAVLQLDATARTAPSTTAFALHAIQRLLGRATGHASPLLCRKILLATSADQLFRRALFALLEKAASASPETKEGSKDQAMAAALRFLWTEEVEKKGRVAVLHLLMRVAVRVMRIFSHERDRAQEFKAAADAKLLPIVEPLADAATALLHMRIHDPVLQIHSLQILHECVSQLGLSVDDLLLAPKLLNASFQASLLTLVHDATRRLGPEAFEISYIGAMLISDLLFNSITMSSFYIPESAGELTPHILKWMPDTQHASSRQALEAALSSGRVITPEQAERNARVLIDCCSVFLSRPDDQYPATDRLDSSLPSLMAQESAQTSREMRVFQHDKASCVREEACLILTNLLHTPTRLARLLSMTDPGVIMKPLFGVLQLARRELSNNSETILRLALSVLLRILNSAVNNCGSKAPGSATEHAEFINRLLGEPYRVLNVITENDPTFLDTAGHLLLISTLEQLIACASRSGEWREAWLGAIENSDILLRLEAMRSTTGYSEQVDEAHHKLFEMYDTIRDQEDEKEDSF